MKHKKLPLLVALTMSLELVIAPVAVHARDKEKKGTSAGEIFDVGRQLLQKGGQALNQLNGGGVDPKFQQQMNMIQQSAMPSLDKNFNYSKFSKMPGFQEFLKSPAFAGMQENSVRGKIPIEQRFNCYTMPSQFHTTHADVCTRGVSTSTGKDPVAQSMEIQSYSNQYLQVSDAYKKYGSSSFGQEFSAPQGLPIHPQQYGFDCMHYAGKVLDLFFKHRIKQLEDIRADVNARFANLAKLTEGDLHKMKEISVVLGGEDHPAASDVMAEGGTANLFDYNKRLQDQSPACFKMMNADEINKTGRATGLRSLETKFTGVYNNTEDGNRYSPKEYLKSHANVVKDIKDLSKSMAKKFRLEFGDHVNAPFSDTLANLSSKVGSSTGVHEGLNKSSKLFLDMQTDFQNAKTALTKRMNVVGQELGPNGSGPVNELLAVDDDAAFDSEISALENNMKAECIASSPLNKAINTIYDPNLTDNANKATTASIRDQIFAIMTNKKTSNKRKLEEMRELNLDRFQVNLSTGYDVEVEGQDGKMVKVKRSASDRVPPIRFAEDVIANCEAKFNNNTLANNRLTAKAAMKELRALKKEFKKFAEDQSRAIEQKIYNQMVNCGGNSEDANNTVGNSCSPKLFNMTATKPGFCASSANACAGNMKSCSENVEKMVKDMKKDRNVLKENFNAEMKRTKDATIALLRANLFKVRDEGEKLAGIFGSDVYRVPDMEWDVDKKDPERFMTGDFLPEDQINLENPEAIKKLFMKNIKGLEDGMRAQQNAILNDPDSPTMDFAEKRKAEFLALEGKALEIKNKCDGAYNKYADGLDQMNAKGEEMHNKAQGEFGEKMSALCGKYDDVMAQAGHPIPGCTDGLRDLTNGAVNAAMKAGQPDVAEHAKTINFEIMMVCKKFGTNVDKEGNSKSTTTFEDVCTKAQRDKKPDKNAVAILSKYYTEKIITIPDVCKKISANKYDVDCGVKYITVGKDDSADVKPVPDCSNLMKDVVAKYDDSKLIGEKGSDDDYDAGSDYTAHIGGMNYCTASSGQQSNSKSGSGKRNKDGKKVVKY